MTDDTRPDRKLRCRVLSLRTHNRCQNEALDAEMGICLHHLQAIADYWLEIHATLGTRWLENHRTNRSTAA